MLKLLDTVSPDVLHDASFQDHADMGGHLMSHILTPFRCSDAMVVYETLRNSMINYCIYIRINCATNCSNLLVADRAKARRLSKITLIINIITPIIGVITMILIYKTYP